MKVSRSLSEGRRILVVVWGLVVVTMAAEASILMGADWILDDLRGKRSSVDGRKETLHGIAAEIHALLFTGGERFNALFTDFDNPAPTRDWIDRLEILTAFKSDETNPAIVHEIVSRINSSIKEISIIWQQGEKWREASLPVYDDIDHHRSTNLIRNLLRDLDHATSQDLGTEQPSARKIHDGLDELSRAMEVLAHAQDTDTLNITRHSLLEPTLDEIRRNIIILNKEEPKQLFGRIQEKLLGSPENGGQGGLIKVRGDFLQLRQERDQLIQRLAALRQTLEKERQSLARAIDAYSNSLTRQMEEHITLARTRILQVGTLFTLLLLALALFASGAVRGQIQTITAGRKRLRSIMDNVEEAILSLGSDGAIQMVNRSAERLFDVAPGGLNGEDINRRIQSPDGPVLSLVGSDGKGERRKMTGIRSDGSRFPLDVSAARITNPDGDGDGEVAAYTLVARDITGILEGEKRNERALVSRITVSALLETSLEPLTLKRQLQVALDIVLAVPWLAIHSKGSIFLVDEETGELVMTVERGLNDTLLSACARIKPGFCLCGRAALGREILFVNHLDERHDVRFPGIQDHGHYCVPIYYRDKLLGVLNLYVPAGYEKNPEEDAFFTTISNTLAGVIQHRRIEAELGKERRFVSAVLETVGSLVVVLDASGRIILFNRACEEITGFTSEEMVGRNVWDRLVPNEEVPAVKKMFSSLKAGELTGTFENHWLTRSQEPRLIQWANTILTNSDGSIRNVIATGIDITEQRSAEERLRFLAHHDTLTGLPNRLMFLEHLERALARARREHTVLAVLFMDLDRFKFVNDTLGHEYGDLLLVEVAQRIRGCLRASDTLARMGGDEFTILLTVVRSEEDACLVAEKIITSLRQPFDLRGNPCQIGSSVGISFFPTHGDEPETLLKKADVAMYRVKQRGRNDFLVFREGMRLEDTEGRSGFRVSDADQDTAEQE